MKCIVCEKPGKFELISKEAPTELMEGHALLKMKRVGICGTDLHAYKGNQPFFTYPRVLGHELAAEVLEVAENEQDLAVGDKVVIMPYINNPESEASLAGKPNCCPDLEVYGVHTDGGMQEIISFPTRLLIKANHLSFDEIAIVEPLSIGAHSIHRAAVKKEDTVVVMGCGPIGIGIIGLCNYLGATTIAVDVNDYRLNVVKENFGANYTVNALNNAEEAIKEITQGKLADIVIDATGNKMAIENGHMHMKHGGTYVLVGLFKGELSFYHPHIHAKETSLLCSRNATLTDFEFVMKVLGEKAFNSAAYVTSTVDFERILSDFDTWSSPASKEIKVLTRL